MTIWIVEIDRDSDRDDVVSRLRKIGDVQELKVIRYIVRVEGKRTKIEAVPGVKAVHDPNQTVQSGATLNFAKGGAKQWTSNFALAMASKLVPFNGFHDFLEHNPHTIDFSPAEDGTGVSVYVVDSGIEAHTEFDGGRLQPRIYESTGMVGTALYFHGTSVASALAGANLGMAPGATIYDSRVFGTSGTGTFANMVLGVDAAADHYVAGSVPGVLNLSAYSTLSSNPFGTMVADCVDVGLPFVGIAGNEGSDLASVASWPGESVDCITVGGLDPRRRRHINSNYGAAVDLWAYYGPMRLASLSNTFVHGFGTSFAAPIISGIAARLLEGEAKMTNRTQCEAFRAILEAASINGLYDVDGTPQPTWKLGFLEA